MTTALVVFCIALAGLVALFWHKMAEMKSGSPMISSALRDKSDHLVRKGIYEKKDVIIARSKDTASAFVTHARMASYSFIVRLLHTLHDKIAHLLEYMKGKRINDKNKGAVSFFLQHVAEYKQEGKESRDPSVTEGL